MSTGTYKDDGPAGRLATYVLDVPNVVTLIGLVLGFAALVETTRGRLGLGLCLVLLAIIVDNVDGALARRDIGRSATMKSFGAHLDCFADFVSKGLFPPLLLVAVLGHGSATMAIGCAHVVAIALRYSWELGTAASPRGLSPDYAIVVFAAIQLGRDGLGNAHGPLLAAAMLVLVALALAPFEVPKLRGWGLRGFMALLAGLAIALLLFG